jgi:hypothetical protein
MPFGVGPFAELGNVGISRVFVHLEKWFLVGICVVG